MNRWSLRHVLRNKEGEGGGGGGGGVDIEATVNRLLAQKGANEAVTELLRDNFRQREELRDLRKDLEAAKKTVPEGGVVLDATQAAAWKQYQELGKPEDLKQAVERKDELEKTVSRNTWAKGAADAAEAHGWKSEVLQKLPGAEKLRFEVKEETVDGEKAKVAYVTTDQQGATPQKLADYADANWKEFLPALEAEDAEAGEREEEPVVQERRMVRQVSRGRSGQKGALPAEKVQEQKRRDRRYSSL